MRIKFKIILLLPILFTSVGCSKTDKLSFKSGSLTFDTYYNDSYFLLNNEDLHEEIALASHAMALSTFNFNVDYSKRNEDLVNLWHKENFEHLWFNQSYYEKPTTDSIGFGIASKYIALEEGFTLLAIAVRGGYYDGEWASNFTLGIEGNAQGFDEASDMVVQGITDFISNFEIKGKVKFWLSGYSRAGITSNMTAGKILNRWAKKDYLSSEVSYTSDDIYAYCFEPPMGVFTTLENARGELYHGIHNFINYNDPVPLVAPFEWGFTRYGVDHYYPDRLNDIYFDATERKKIISLYHFTYGAQNFSDYNVDDWKFFDVGKEVASKNNLPRESINPSQGRFNRTLVKELALRGIESRKKYVDAVQEGARALMATFYGLNEEIGKIDFGNITQIIFEYDFIKTIIMELMEDRSSQFAMDVEMLFLQIFGANEDNFEAVEKLYSDNYQLFIMFANAYAVRKDIITQLLYRDNAMGLITCHMPEVSYSFLCACDSRFYGDKKCQFNDGTYNILHLENPKSFALFEKNLKAEVFSYIDGKMESEYLSAEKYADGSIDIYLPTNGAYEYICEGDGISMSRLDPLEGEKMISASMPQIGEF